MLIDPSVIEKKEEYEVACNLGTRGKLIYEAGGCAPVLPVMEERGGGASVEKKKMSERRGEDNR